MYCLSFIHFWARGMWYLSSHQELNLHPPAREGEVSISGLPGKSFVTSLSKGLSFYPPAPLHVSSCLPLPPRLMAHAPRQIMWTVYRAPVPALRFPVPCLILRVEYVCFSLLIGVQLIDNVVFFTYAVCKVCF